jgi:hypothetical protein
MKKCSIFEFQLYVVPASWRLILHCKAVKCDFLRKKIWNELVKEKLGNVNSALTFAVYGRGEVELSNAVMVARHCIPMIFHLKKYYINVLQFQWLTRDFTSNLPSNNEVAKSQI